MLGGDGDENVDNHRKISWDNHLKTNEAGYELKERLTISVITGNIPAVLAKLAYMIIMIMMIIIIIMMMMIIRKQTYSITSIFS